MMTPLRGAKRKHLRGAPGRNPCELVRILHTSRWPCWPVSASPFRPAPRIAADCLKLVHSGPRPIAETRTERFEGKVGEPAADCRGGAKALAQRGVPWVDWSNYWGSADAASKSDKSDRLTVPPLFRHLLDRNTRGLDGALMDLEYQRMELIKFNLFDNRTYEQYVTGRKVGKEQVDGSVLKVWREMRLAANHPNIGDVLSELVAL